MKNLKPDSRQMQRIDVDCPSLRYGMDLAALNAAESFSNIFIFSNEPKHTLRRLVDHALDSALQKGRNQVFIGTDEMVQKARQIFSEMLGDEEIRAHRSWFGTAELKNGATFRFFLSHEKHFAGYSGDVYLLDAMALEHFQQINSVAIGLAARRGYKKIYLTSGTENKKLQQVESFLHQRRVSLVTYNDTNIVYVA